MQTPKSTRHSSSAKRKSLCSLLPSSSPSRPVHLCSLPYVCALFLNILIFCLFVISLSYFSYPSSSRSHVQDDHSGARVHIWFRVGCHTRRHRRRRSL
jgi:hypothetical protein